MGTKFETMTSCAVFFALVALLSQICWSEPGHVIATSPMAGAPRGSTAWRIRYETTDQNRKPTESTAILVAPNGPAPSGGRNVVAWAHGTTGIAESCAPSLGSNALTSIPDLAGMLGRGWTIVATDYPGLGTPGPHAYLVGDAAAHAVLDSVRAARQFPRAGAVDRTSLSGVCLRALTRLSSPGRKLTNMRPNCNWWASLQQHLRRIW